MKVVVIKALGKPETVELPEKNNYEDLLKLLECSCLTIATRKIGNIVFDIYCDDEGLLYEKKYVTALCKNAYEILCGNLVITQHDGEGNTIGLTDEEIATVYANLDILKTGKLAKEYNGFGLVDILSEEINRVILNYSC